MNFLLKVLMIFIMTLAGSLGAFFFKQTMARLANFNIFHIIFIPQAYIGGLCYCIGMGMNILLLRYMDYTVVYPMTSLTYIWTLGISYIFLKEKLTFQKWIAIGCILLGIFIISL